MSLRKDEWVVRDDMSGVEVGRVFAHSSDAALVDARRRYGRRVTVDNLDKDPSWPPNRARIRYL